MKPRLGHAGVSLVEVLVVCGILLLLCAIALPVFSRARLSAEVSSNIVKMQQLGHAFALYTEQTGDFPVSAKALDLVIRLPRSTYLTGLDQDPNGMANTNCQGHPDPGLFCTDFPRSFLAYTDFGGKLPFFKKDLVPEAGAGWLVDGSQLDRGVDGISTWSGTYRRLTLEGSVVVRKIQPITGTDSEGRPYQASHHYLFLCDPSKEKIREWLRL